MAAPQRAPSKPAASRTQPLPSGRTVSLASLEPGDSGVIERVEPEDAVAERLRDLGFVSGTRIAVLRRAPLGDPVLYEFRGTQLSLRRVDAARIRVLPSEASGDDAR